MTGLRGDVSRVRPARVLCQGRLPRVRPELPVPEPHECGANGTMTLRDISEGLC